MPSTTARFSPSGRPTPADVAQIADFYRIDDARKLDADRRSELRQFFTPLQTAKLMASMASIAKPTIRLLDAGAGVGSLTAAWVAEMCQRTPPEVHQCTRFSAR